MPVERQQKSEWCWAAVAVSLARHLHTSLQSQCELATRLTHAACCPVNGFYVPPGNVPLFLGDVLTAVGLPNTFQGRVPFEDLKKSIDRVSGRGRPVPAQIRWDGSDQTHFVYVDGYIESADPARRSVQVRDPRDGSTRPLYFDDFQDNYPGQYPDQNVGRGRWFATFLI